MPGDLTNPYKPGSDFEWFWNDEVRRLEHARDCEPEGCCPAHREHRGSLRWGDVCIVCATDEEWARLDWRTQSEYREKRREALAGHRAVGQSGHRRGCGNLTGPHTMGA